MIFSERKDTVRQAHCFSRARRDTMTLMHVAGQTSMVIEPSPSVDGDAACGALVGFNFRPAAAARA
jgi:hypothetical protein